MSAATLRSDEKEKITADGRGGTQIEARSYSPSFQSLIWDTTASDLLIICVYLRLSAVLKKFSV